MTNVARFSLHIFAREAVAFLEAAKRLSPDLSAERPQSEVRSPTWFALGHSVELAFKTLAAARHGGEPKRTHSLEELARSALSPEEIQAMQRSASRRALARRLCELRRRFPARDGLSIAMRRHEHLRVRQRPYDLEGILACLNNVHGSATNGSTPYRTRYAELGVVRYPLWCDAVSLGEVMVDRAVAVARRVPR